MNRDLFLNGFIDRISQRFGLSATFAFEILAIAAVLDMTFDEVMDNVSSIMRFIKKQKRTLVLFCFFVLSVEAHLSFKPN